MQTSRPDDDLEPKLAQAEAELVDRLEEACALEPEEPGAEDTGELLRLEEKLDAARAAAERVVELRRARRAREADAESSGVREFRDGTGRQWRVWLVLPSDQGRRAATRVGAEFRAGWLAFEALDGTERRRLPDHPTDWSTRSEPALAELLGRANPVTLRRASAEQGEQSSGHESHPA